MRSKTVVRSKNWNHVMDPSTSKVPAPGKAPAPRKAPMKGVSEVKGKQKPNKSAKVPKKSTNVVEDSEEDNGGDEQSDEYSEDDSCSPSEFMKMMMQFMKSKSSRKRKRSKGEISEGQKVLREGAVLKTHHENVGKYPNIVCRVESFCQAVKHFDSRRRALVTQMGFQGLLEIDMKNIPRQFCYWLMTRVLPDGTMVFGQSEVLPLGPAQVRSVLGLPTGAEKVPFDVGEDDEEKVEKMRRIFDLYGVGSNKETISLKNASDALCPLDESGQPIPLADEVDEEDFMVAFLLVALGKVVCTTTNNSNFAKSLLPALTVATEAVKYDWCSLTFEWLCDTANRFHRKFQKDGFRSGCGGSFLFIMIYYLDHLHRVPVQWGVYPRVKVWNSVEVKAALLEDKVSTNEYGKLAAVDIAYGEEHPLVPREDDGNKAVVSENEVSVDVVDRVLGHLESKLETIVEGLIGTALTNFVSKMTGTPVDQFVGFQNVVRRDENAGSTGPRNEKAASTGSRRDGNGWINGHRAEVIPSPKKDGADDNSADRSSPNLEEGPRPNKLSPFHKRILCFVRGWKELKSDTEDCYRVVSPKARVGDHYVRVASVLYTKSWASQHTRKRIMMDPSYANFVMVGKDDPKELGQKYGKTFLSYSLDQIQSVFVPVLDASVKNAKHWYCLALDLKAHVVWMIDSLYEDPYLKHDKCHQQLMVALEELLHLSEPTWQVGTTSTWLRRTFPVRQADNCSCGAIMLSSIKHCARSFEAPYHMEKHTSSLRNNLFLEDVNSEFNELHANLEKILPKERRGGRRTGSQMS